MARVSYKEAQEVASKSGNFDFGFLALKDKESKRIRFLHQSMDDIPSFTVHSVKVVDINGNDKTKNVDCLRAINEPIQKCPLCAIANKTRARIYLSLVDEDTHELLVWERSGSFLNDMEGYFTRYGDLRDYVFDIERKGTGLDTKYNLYPIGPSPIQDKSVLPAIPDVYGKLVLDKTAEEQQYFIQYRNFPERTNPQVDTANLQRREAMQNPQQYYTPPEQVFGNNQPQNQQPQEQQSRYQQPPTSRRSGW